MKVLTNITRYYYPIGAKLHYNGKGHNYEWLLNTAINNWNKRV